MSTFLQLGQQTHRLIRAGNAIPGSQPTTMVGNTDPLLLDIVYFVQEAWAQIQEDHPSWFWMRQSATLTLPLNTSAQYNQTLTNATIVAAVPNWRNVLPMYGAQNRYMLIFDPGWASLGQTSPTHQPIYLITWQEFHGFYDRLPRSSAQPIRVAEDPNYNLIFDPPPLNAPSGSSTAYQVLTNYRTTTQVLVNNTDVPNMPADYHNIIPWWAAMLYCQTRGASANTSNLLESCQSNVARIMMKLRDFQLQEFTVINDYG